MGGYGSGRPALRGVIEQRWRLDVRTCARHGRLRPGAVGTLSWTQDGEEAGSASYRALEEALELRYAIASDQDERIPVSAKIGILRRPCRFGGRRSYWQCPRCGRTCEVVVMATHGKWWGCRRCMRLRYHSQGLDRGDRLQRRADEIYARAGIESEDGKLIHKHKWMRWRTFNQTMDRANALSGAADAAFLYSLRRLGFVREEAATAFVLGDAPAAAEARTQSETVKVR